MRNKKQHILTVLLILIMSILTVATSVSLPPHYDRMNYEIHDEYLYININTINDIDNYLNISSLSIRVTVQFRENENIQIFENDHPKKQYMITTITQTGMFTNRKTEYFDNPLFEILTENDMLIIKMSTNLIRYDNYYAYNVFIQGNTGIYLEETYK
jgi:hypothetical protein